MGPRVFEFVYLNVYACSCGAILLRPPWGVIASLHSGKFAVVRAASEEPFYMGVGGDCSGAGWGLRSEGWSVRSGVASFSCRGPLLGQ